MTYQPPPKEQPPKPRYVKVTDAGEIAAIQRSGFADPIGMGRQDETGIHWYAEVNSLRMYRERLALAAGGQHG